MSNNPLVTLLSPRGQKQYGNVSVKELLETYTLDNKHLTKTDKQKIQAIKETIEAYTRTPDLDQQITNSRSAMSFFEPLLHNLDHEEVIVAVLNTKNYVIHYETVFKGSLSECISHPREVMRMIMKYPAARFMMAHNHPSGNPEPSIADVQNTKRMEEIGDLIGIPLMDHIIIGNGSNESLKEYGVF